MASHIQISKLFLHDPTVARSQTEIFTAVAEDNEELQLLLIVDFPRSRQEQAYLLDLIIKECVNAFDQADESNPEILLEQILNALNALLPQITPQKQGQWLRQLNLLVAIIDNGQLHFAQTGEITAHLIREGQMIKVSEPNPDFNVLKIFSNITSGIINPGEAMLFSTGALLDYVSETKIQQAIETQSPYQAVDHIERYLQEVPTFVTFAAIIAKFMPVSTTGRTVPVAARVSPSPTQQPKPKIIYEPRARVTETETMPSPRLSRQQRRLQGSGPRLSLGQIAHFLSWLTATIWLYLQLLGVIISRLGQGLGRGLKFFFNRPYRQRVEHAWWQSLESKLHDYHTRLTLLTNLQKAVFAVSLFVLIAVLNIIVFQGQGRQGNSLLRAYNETLLIISQKQAEADSQRSYNNDKGAESILLEIETVLRQLQPQSQEQEKQVADLLEKNNRALNEVRHINYVENPVEAFNLVAFNQTFSSLVFWQGRLYIAATDGLYQLQPETKKIAPGAFENPRLLPAAEALFILDGSSLWKLNGETLEAQIFNQQSQIDSVDAAILYNDNLYILDRSRGAIVRHSGNGQTFRDGTVWLDDTSLLQSAIDFAIDGNIYVTRADGEIIKLFKGQRETFDYQKPYPALGNNTLISTRLESDLLYVSDPQYKRLIIISKTGSINDQFSSPKFTDIKSFAVDGEEKNIYLLSGSSVYQLPIRK